MPSVIRQKEIIVVPPLTYPWTVGNQLKDGLKGEAHGKCKVHVGEKICEEQRSAVKLVAGQIL